MRGRLKFSMYYLHGPVLGHRFRMEALQRAIVSRGHIMSSTGPDVDWHIEDYPEPGMLSRAIMDEHYRRRLVMGMPPVLPQDWSWNPLGEAGPRTITGSEYIIVGQDLPTRKRNNWMPEHLVVSCGGADIYHITERIIENLTSWRHFKSVVIGPNFGRQIEVPPDWTVYQSPSHEKLMEILANSTWSLLTWGQTVFESIALGVNTVAISHSNYGPEIAKLGMKPVIDYQDISNASIVEAMSKMVPPTVYGIDRLGASRTIRVLEDIAESEDVSQ